MSLTPITTHEAARAFSLFKRTGRRVVTIRRKSEPVIFHGELSALQVETECIETVDVHIDPEHPAFYGQDGKTVHRLPKILNPIEDPK